MTKNTDQMASKAAPESVQPLSDKHIYLRRPYQGQPDHEGPGKRGV